jgi:hypothetical protein
VAAAAQAVVQTTNVGVDDVRVVCRQHFFDSEYVWRIRVPAEKVDLIASELGLVETPLATVPPLFWRVFPRSWFRATSEDREFFATSQFPDNSRGPDGEHYFVMYDGKSQLMFVWYKFNF